MADGGTYLSRTRDYLGSIRKDLGDLQGWRALVAELIQNADDAQDATRMRFTVTDDGLEVWNDGTFSSCADIGADSCLDEVGGTGACDFHSFRKVAGASKAGRDETTGAFGIGFTSVYQVTDKPVLNTSGYEWTIDETATEHERIHSRTVGETEGTRFWLPFASTRTKMREALEQEPMTPERVRELERELLAASADSMLFLRRLNEITVVGRNDRAVHSVDRQPDAVTITRSDGGCRTWLLLRDEIDSTSFQSRHPDIVDDRRSRLIEVAVRSDGHAEHGRYFATLPTDESTQLPVSVNGSFWPKPDRKRIRLDNAAQDHWNRLLIDHAARVLAESLETVREVCGDDLLVDLLLSAVSLDAAAREQRADRSARAWWRELKEVLEESAVVPRISGGHGTTKSVVLWSGDEAELQASRLLAKLGVELIDPGFRAKWFELRSPAEIRVLGLGHVVTAIATRSDWKTWSAGLSRAETDILLALIDNHLSTRGRSTEEARAALDKIPFIPTVGGGSAALPACKQARSGLVRLLEDAGIDAPIAAPTATRHPALSERIGPVNVEDVARWFAEADNENRVPEGFDRNELLEYFVRRASEVSPAVASAVSGLRIFPTAGGPSTLSNLALPAEGFKDPLGIGTLIDLRGLPSGTRDFLHQLGARDLDLAHYCTDVIPAAVNQGLSETLHQRLIDFLAENLSSFEIDPDVELALRPLPLVRCTDHELRPGPQCYFPAVDKAVIPSDAAILATSGDIRAQHLYEWLGVARKPRPSDVARVCRQLDSEPATASEVADAVLRHLQRLSLEDLDPSYSDLRSIRWLPVEDKPGVVRRPNELASRYQQPVFASQADFVGIGRALENDSRDLLEWLGVQISPTAEQVVAHLEHCRANAQPVKGDMWKTLHRFLDDPALAVLEGDGWVHLGDGRWVDATTCFWSSNPFGGGFHLLGPGFDGEARDVLTFFGVRDEPQPETVINVLGDLAARHSGSRQPVLAHERELVERSWVFLNHQLLAESCTPEDLAELRSIECVLDGAGRLRRPDEVLFRDSMSIVEHFDADVRHLLVPRPENTRTALEAVGVRRLREVVRTDRVEGVEAPGKTLVHERLHRRRPALLRLLSNERADAMQLLERFEHEAKVVSVVDLMVCETIELGGRTHSTDGIPRYALFDPTRSELLVDEGEPGARHWDQIARETVEALLPGGDSTGMLPIALKAVLELEDDAEVHALLDSMGVPPLDDAVHIVAVDAVVAPLDDAESDASDQVPESAEVGSSIDDSGAVPAPEQEGPPDAAHDAVPPDEKDADAGAAGTDAQLAPDTGADEGNAGETAGADETDSTKAPGRSPSGDPRKPASTTRTPRERGRMRSYVSPAGTDPNVEGSSERSPVDVAAVERVLAYERRKGREPEEQAHENPGFDIISRSPDGSIRYIEVKGTSQRWDSQGVAISSRQFETARKLENEFWLYVVEVDRTGTDPIRIQDPANLISQYFFDRGWEDVAEGSDAGRAPVPALPLTRDPGAGRLPILDPADGATIIGHLESPLAAPGRHGMQLVGDHLGFDLRGGLAVFDAEGDPEPEDDDYVVVDLGALEDPETGSSVTVRLWRAVEVGGELVGVRLESMNGSPPLTIEDLEALTLLGIAEVHSLSDLGLGDLLR